MSNIVYVLNGPNLNMLGGREPGHYGTTTLDDIHSACAKVAPELGVEIDFRQTNHEGELVDWIQEAGSAAAGIVLNPAAYGHTSIAIHDAIRAVKLPVIEVHVSNIYAREEFRRHTMVSSVAKGVICGFGGHGYVLALRAIAQILGK